MIAYSELIIALACAVGTDNSIVIDELKTQLKDFNYETKVIKISKNLIEEKLECELEVNSSNSSFNRTKQLMDAGNNMRKAQGTVILAQGVVSEINNIRNNVDNNKGIAYIIDSLKHEDEVNKLKEIYTSAFYLFAINESESDREEYLERAKNIGGNNAIELIERDAEEILKHGQHTKRVFQLADFHLSVKGWRDNFKDAVCNGVSYKDKVKKFKQPIIKKQLTRILDLMFANPYITPTFDEYAMFMAYSSSLRSADLSRQVGAVIAKDHDIISTGANDVPAPMGGQYWPDSEIKLYKDETIENTNELRGYDIAQGRDYTWGFDPNKHEIDAIISEIINSFNYDDFSYPDISVDEYKESLRNQLLKSPLKYLTEFSRAVHAEMAAMLSCSRIGVSVKGATLYCTTFPCHNCARHAVFAGIERIVFIEPYLKSKAIDLHKDSMTINDENGKVKLEQFVGVGPRRFFDLFSLRLSTGRDIIRKESEKVISYTRNNACLRCGITSGYYLSKEKFEILDYASKFE